MFEIKLNVKSLHHSKLNDYLTSGYLHENTCIRILIREFIFFLLVRKYLFFGTEEIVL